MKQENPFSEIVETKEIDGVITIDARELHKRLKVKTRFNDWIERRIQDFSFQEGIEFYSNLSKNKSGRGRPNIEYFLTVSMAQEICVLDNSEIGKRIRLFLLSLLNNGVGPLAILQNISFIMDGERKLYHYREAQRVLGYSTKSSLSNVRLRFANQLVVINRVAYVTPEYAELMVLRSRARKTAVKTLDSKPIDENQLSLF